VVLFQLPTVSCLSRGASFSKSAALSIDVLFLLLQVSVLDYQSTQLKLMPLLATAYCLHFAKDHLVNLYCDMKRTKDALLIEEVHSLR
jgi:hypothetical protein